MVETDTVKRVLEGEASLDLVSLDGSSENVLDSQRLLSVSDVGTADPVGNGEDGANVVGRVTPLGGEPGVVEVEPSDQSTVVECGTDGIKLVIGTNDTGTVGDNSAGDNGTADVSSGREAESLHGASQRVEQAETSSFVSDLGVDLVVVDVVGNVLEDLIGRRTGVVLTLSNTGVTTHDASRSGERGGASGKVGKKRLVGELSDGSSSNSGSSGKSRGGDRSSGGGSKRCSQSRLRKETRHLCKETEEGRKTIRRQFDCSAACHDR